MKSYLMTNNFVTKTIFKKIQAHIATKYSSLKQFFVAIFFVKKFVAKTYFLFLILSWL